MSKKAFFMNETKNCPYGVTHMPVFLNFENKNSSICDNFLL